MGPVEAVNIEHLLNTFTSVHTNSEEAWGACSGFVARLSQHSPRLVTLGSKIEGLPDYHPSKPRCLFRLSDLFLEVGDYVESKRHLTHLLKLWRDRGDHYQIALTLLYLTKANEYLNLFKEAIRQTKEALETFEQLKDAERQAQSLSLLAVLFLQDNQSDIAEETGSRAITLLPGNSKEIIVYRCHQALGEIHRVKCNHEKAIECFKFSLKIATSHNWNREAFWVYFPLVLLFVDGGRFDDANAHLESAWLHAANNSVNSSLEMWLQSYVFFRQNRFEEARFECLRAVEALEKIGVTVYSKLCRGLLARIADKSNGGEC